jgi:hypothetical protein
MHRRAWLELEAGAELGDRQFADEKESRDRLFVGLGYRVNF